MNYTVIFEHGPEEDGRDTWSAYVPDLSGCVSAGDTREECESMIREAIASHLEGMRAEGLPIPEPTTEAARIEVAA